tara:strand:+ start:479 stop:796 length:318 start_codon:yes stop_codon:yes gene_type:complete
MEEEMRQGMMGADVDTSPAAAQPMELRVSARQVSNNLQNLGEQERELITQLNVPQFRDFMSKVFGPEFGMVMQEAIPEPQQPVSQPSESPAPMMGQGMMTQPPSQ